MKGSGQDNGGAGERVGGVGGGVLSNWLCLEEKRNIVG